MESPPLDPQYKGHWGPSIVGLLASLNALVVIVTLLRVTTRLWIVRSFWWDDLTIILATVRFFAFPVPFSLPLHEQGKKTDWSCSFQLGTAIGGTLGCLEVTFGFGTREAYLTPHQIIEFQKYTYGEWIQTFFTLMWTKVSICLFLMRIPHSNRYRRPLQWAVAFLLFSNVVLAMMWILQCQPIRATWDNSGDGGCFNHEVLCGIILAQAIISLVSDFSFAVLPILLLWRVQIDFKTKIGLWLLMCLGFITGACCLVRTVINNQALPKDGSYDGIVNWVWRTFEVQIGIIAACIPTLRPLYMRLMGSRRPGDDSLGTNVRYLGRGKSPDQLCLEHAPTGRGWSRSPMKDGFQDPEKEITRFNYTPRYPVPPPQGALRGPCVQERTESKKRQLRKIKNGLVTPVGDDMLKYGIKKSPFGSWDENLEKGSHLRSKSMGWG